AQGAAAERHGPETAGACRPAGGPTLLPISHFTPPTRNKGRPDIAVPPCEGHNGGLRHSAGPMLSAGPSLYYIGEIGADIRAGTADREHLEWRISRPDPRWPAGC